MSKTVVQQLIEANERAEALKADIAAMKAKKMELDRTAKVLEDKLAAKGKSAGGTVSVSATATSQAQAEYATLHTSERRAFRVKNWKLLGISEER